MMDPRLLRYYDRELQFMRGMGAEFAREYPKIAGRLGLDATRLRASRALAASRPIGGGESVEEARYLEVRVYLAQLGVLLTPEPEAPP